MLGTLLNKKYRLVRHLGQGGMGTVFVAEDVESKRTVALKILDPRAANSDSLRRFRRESRAAGAIQNEHIVQVFDAGLDEAAGHPYIVMELLEGEDLQQLIDRVGPLPPDTALRIAAQALQGLIAAHAAGIIHRDIKPSNLFLARQPDGSRVVKLLDFGIAKIQGDPAKAAQSAGMTATGALLGSPLYMSPEQVLTPKDVDARSDIWSLGSVVYCSLTGAAPHVNSSAAVGRLLVTICNEPIPPLETRAPWVPENIIKVVAPALERVPDDRYPTAAAMLSALEQCLPSGLTLRDSILVTANTGNHVVVRPTVTTANGNATTEDGSLGSTVEALGADETLAKPVEKSAVLRSNAFPAVDPPRRDARRVLGIGVLVAAVVTAISVALVYPSPATPGAPLASASPVANETSTHAPVTTPAPSADPAPQNVPAAASAPTALPSQTSLPDKPTPNANSTAASGTNSNTTSAPTSVPVRQTGSPSSKPDAPKKPPKPSDPLFEREAKGE